MTMADYPSINLALYAQTDVGMVRSGNEDNFLILDLSSGKSWTANEEEPQELLTYSQGYYGSLLAVSDGMGGALAGEVASRMAVETVRDRMLQLQAHEVYGKMSFSERLRLSIEEANLLINGESQTNPAHKGLGATFTAVATHGNNVYFGQVGDSRAYLIRQGRIYRITKDQSLVQQLIDAGQITEEEAETHSYRNVILQALGAHNNVNVEVNTLSLCQMDTLLLCSDGLSGKMNQDEMVRIVNQAGDFKSACQQLIRLANERGGEDNITVVLAQFSGAGLPLSNDVTPHSLARSPDTPTEINWSAGAKTDPLDDASQTSPAADSKATEPLPPPPTQATPFTARLQRDSANLPRTNDLSDRRGPITAVFSVEELDDPRLSSQSQSSSSTAPLDRGTSPLHPADTSSSLNPQSGRTSNSGAHTSASTVGKKSSRPNLLIFIGLLVLGVAGLVVSATSYFRQQRQERDAQQQAQLKLQAEHQKEKEGRIGRLRDKIAEINKKLQANDKPSLKEKREAWNQSLNKLSLRLDEVNQMSSEELAQISLACDEINQELKKIEDEVNSLQGLLPPSLSNRDPIKV